MPGVGKFAGVTSGLDSIGKSLDGVVGKARNAQGVIGETRRAAQGLSTDLDAVDRRTDETVQRQERARKELVDKAREAFSQLDALYAAAKDGSDNWSADFALQLEAVKIGAKDIEDLVTLYGDARIQINGELVRIRDAVRGADLGAIRQQLQDLIDGIRTGSTDLAAALAFLKDNAGELAAGLIQTVEAFRRGEATLDQVLARLRQFREQFSGSEFDAFAQALEQGLLAGDLA